ncbi:MAG: hypothetical protein Q4C12_01665 [Clostridia bacterium]|nr:hypothetical protein [Clostridia bacterium]
MDERNEKLCREIGVTAADIICLWCAYEETPEEFCTSLMCSARYEDKENIIADMRSDADRISAAVYEMDIDVLDTLYRDFGISLTEYSDSLNRSLTGETIT